MAAKFVAEEGALKGLILTLEGGDQWIIGRDPDVCQLLVEDASASRKHVMCRATPDGISIENLSETNPVEVNKEKIEKPRLLQNSDHVKIGATTFRFYAEEAIEPNDNDNNTNEKKPPMNNENELNPSEVDEPKAPTEEIKKTDIEESAAEQNESGQENALLPSPQKAETPPPQIKEEESAESLENKSLPSRYDSIFDNGQNEGEKHPIAEINFGLLDAGRWLLKVVGGPNNGAEFSMQTGNTYVIGTDPNACDIVFHDTSVSRQHAKITISQDDVISIEDLRSRNGTLIDGKSLKEKQLLTPNVLISIGTTSFVVFDREGQMQTIISPLMPSIVKVLQEEPQKKTTKNEENSEKSPSGEQSPILEKPAPAPESHPSVTLGALILIGILTGLIVIIGIGTSTLFRSEPVPAASMIDTSKLLDAALAPFPSVKYTFNPGTGQLFLVGHVLTTTDKSQLLYALQGMSFIKSLDDSGVVIDEYVWRETDQILQKNPEWKGITVISPSPGHFVLSGYLMTRSDADRLTEYLNANFPYPDLLENKVIIDQEVLSSATGILQAKGLKSITPKLDNGEVVLSGGVPTGKEDAITAAVAEIKEIRGVRGVRNMTSGLAPDESVVNISSSYEVTGVSSEGSNISVIINGRILMKGDSLDGMTITKIQSNAVFLEKDTTKYRIDFNL